VTARGGKTVEVREDGATGPLVGFLPAGAPPVPAQAPRWAGLRGPLLPRDGLAVNVVLVLVAPDQFVALGTDAPIFVPYEWFFGNVVALAPPVFGLLAAAYEIAVALLMLSKGRYVKWGLIGGICFLVTITPLGVWTIGNPIMALALAYLLTKEYRRSPLQMLRLGTAPRAR
jgi:hypothetical protein